MNPKRLILAILAVFLGVFLTDFLIHGIWLDSSYKLTASLWRTEAEMQKHFGWLLLAQFFAAATFTVVWATGIAGSATIYCAGIYGATMGVFSQANTLITYAVQPFPADIALKWFASGVVRGCLMGLLVFFIYKPLTRDSKNRAIAI